MTRKMESTKMNGLRRPHNEVHESDQWPITGTVNNAMNGATPNIIDICVSLYPDFSSRGGMNVKATEEAISSPATTKLTSTNRRSLILMLAGPPPLPEQLPRLLIFLRSFADGFSMVSLTVFPCGCCTCYVMHIVGTVLHVEIRFLSVCSMYMCFLTHYN